MGYVRSKKCRTLITWFEAALKVVSKVTKYLKLFSFVYFHEKPWTSSGMAERVAHIKKLVGKCCRATQFNGFLS